AQDAAKAAIKAGPLQGLLDELGLLVLLPFSDCFRLLVVAGRSDAGCNLGFQLLVLAGDRFDIEIEVHGLKGNVVFHVIELPASLRLRAWLLALSGLLILGRLLDDLFDAFRAARSEER